jgi:hypothetical protein
MRSIGVETPNVYDSQFDGPGIVRSHRNCLFNERKSKDVKGVKHVSFSFIAQFVLNAVARSCSTQRFRGASSRCTG